jgi:1-aminocyclopropane-1-carboxylate deaminase
MNTIIHKLNYTLDDNQFYIKRDDLIPQYYGGNKVRIAKEYYRDMMEKKCNCIIAYGSKNSNMCRVIALMSAEKGIPCFIIYGCDVDYKNTFGINDLIVRNTGAIIIESPKNRIKETIESAFKQAKDMGLLPYYIFGNSEGRGNEKIGVEGYVSCYNEIRDYEKKEKIIFDYIFVTSGTGITQAGLITGKVLKVGEEKIVGISIARKKERQEDCILYYISQYFGNMKKWNEEIIEVYDHVLQGGYGHIGEENKKFIFNLRKTDSIPLDYTYIGKGMFGMVKYLRENRIKRKKILFIHTGGTPLFFEDILKNINLEK